LLCIDYGSVQPFLESICKHRFVFKSIEITFCSWEMLIIN
jgi:hypothetical protein